MIDHPMNRRALLGMIVGGAAAATLPRFGHASTSQPLMRPIPKSGERIPAVGMGTWITFNVGQNTALRDQRTEVLRKFFEMGGGMVDSSPMYGSAEDVMGYCLQRLGSTKKLFSATKVWTPSDVEGVEQVADSMRLWGLNKFDLFQIHNLVNWENHLAMLRERKQQGDIRYIGITTSHGGRHDDMLRIMGSEDIDFVQFTYNIADREAERRLLPMAADKGIATIINRPYQRGGLISATAGEPLPPWVSEIGITSWAQYLLSFVISHPAVTCAIPATSKIEHMAENMGRMTAPLPDQKMRQRMVEDFERL